MSRIWNITQVRGGGGGALCFSAGSMQNKNSFKRGVKPKNMLYKGGGGTKTSDFLG